VEELYPWLDEHHPQAIDAAFEAGLIDDRISAA
jgi:hypothetical protein